MRILWSPQSLRDLEAIHEYIARDSQHYADLTVARIFAGVERLAAFRSQAESFLNWVNPRSGKSLSDGFEWCIELGSRR